MTTSTDPVAAAESAVALLRAGRFDELEAMFAPRLRAAVSARTVAVAWTGELARVGPVAGVSAGRPEPAAENLVRVRIPVTCARGGLTVVLAVDTAGQLHGFRLAAADGDWTPPPYARGNHTDHEVAVGEPPRSVPGTVTMPRGRGPHPAVVLLASGPTDRDATTGPNKPFKDLAYGLAARGIAVLRFDKLTLIHGEAATEPGFTMADEYVPHAISAVRLLQRQPGVDPARVFVVGHSGGGKAAPRVAAADPSIAGVAILAGDTVPLARAAVRVTRYLADLEPSETASAAVESVATQAAVTDAPELSPDTPAADLLFGWPATYWLDLRAYDPVATAAALDRPILIIQGGRDYQVTVTDDLARWRTGLAHRPNVTIRVHDPLDHMLFTGTGPSTPADYQNPHHVDPAVITDLADWVHPGHRRNPLARILSVLRQ
ncbi:serine aminopeptidase domain-containing protein [Nocardia sp. alder85J]|uniref:alpha/beta hydrolase n=1 Tax=Nocardia sp. alder85J TaxID=2862949 RepID=UPI001CD2D8FF|nr:alpha/beta hydrolase [Nocardia sp. alder85J]MCX4092238.1 alpha/beta hydrolase [Nocardia sp. alder85J]